MRPDRFLRLHGVGPLLLVTGLVGGAYYAVSPPTFPESPAPPPSAARRAALLPEPVRTALLQERPIFTPDRLPPPAKDSRAGMPPPPLPKLIGIISSAAPKAIFLSESSSQRSVGIGQHIGAWTVRSIDAGSVTLTPTSNDAAAGMPDVVLHLHATIKKNGTP